MVYVWGAALVALDWTNLYMVNRQSRARVQRHLSFDYHRESCNFYRQLYLRFSYYALVSQKNRSYRIGSLAAVFETNQVFAANSFTDRNLNMRCVIKLLRLVMVIGYSRNKDEINAAILINALIHLATPTSESQTTRAPPPVGVVSQRKTKKNTNEVRKNENKQKQ